MFLPRGRRSGVRLRTRIVCWSVLALCLVLLSFSVFASFVRRTTRSSHSLTPSPLAFAQEGSSSGEATTSTKIIAISVTQYGFQPRQMSLPAGEYLLLVRNASRFSDLAVVGHGLAPVTGPPGEPTVGATLAPPTPSPVRDIPVAFDHRRNFRQYVRLDAGTVRFDDATRPGWGCRIDVTP